MTHRVRMKYGTAMRFILDHPAGLHVVHAYGAGMIRIGERSYDRSLIVTGDRIIEDWRPRHIDDLQVGDLELIRSLMPELLLIGSGLRQKFPSQTVYAALHGARLGFEVMDTGAACRTYNLLAAEGRRVAAALIIDSAERGAPA